MAWWETCSRSCPSWLAACDAARVTSCAARPGAFTGHSNNRRGFEARVRSLRSREDVSVALIVCDVDNFKRINDLHGHQSGDKVLASVAETLQEAICKNDVLGRIGGEEFGRPLWNTWGRQGWKKGRATSTSSLQNMAPRRRFSVRA